MINVTADYTIGVTRDYPYIGSDGDWTILFIENDKGIVLEKNHKIVAEIGEYVKGVDENSFEPINGTVTISNK